MANRNYRRNQMSLEANPVALFARVAIGASGAPTMDAKKSLGIYSITRTATGAYTIKLGLNATSLDTYQRLMMLMASFISAASGIASVDVVADNSATLANPNVQILCLDAAGVAADPANGAVMLLKLELSNSTAI